MKPLTLIFLVINLTFSYLSTSQIAINKDGSVPDESALLDISSDSLGVLIPRMSMLKRNAIKNPLVGLMIFQTDQQQGFYYYDGSEWEYVGKSDFANGGETGGLDRSLGNTDNYDLSFKTNNLNRLHIQNDGKIGINETAPLGLFHLNESTLATGSSFLINKKDWDNQVSTDHQFINIKGSWASEGYSNPTSMVSLYQDESWPVLRLIDLNSSNYLHLEPYQFQFINSDGKLTFNWENGLTFFNYNLNPITNISPIDGAIFNKGGGENMDFRIEGTGSPNAFFVKGSNGQIGIGTETPASSALLELNSSNLGFLPPRMSTSEISMISNPDEGLIIYNTTSHKPIYFDGNHWTYFDGSIMLYIGKFYQGGVIFYLDGSGGGLICSVEDQSSGAIWGCAGTNIPGAEGIDIGTGYQNTIDITSVCLTPGYAAYLCDTLTLNGYTDWFLPSKDELNELYLNKSAIDATATVYGGVAVSSTWYWSSSESNGDARYLAWMQYMGDGQQWSAAKSEGHQNVRAIRSF